MSDVTVVVDDGALMATVDLLGRGFEEAAKDALTAAFVLGGVEEAIWRATPKSSRTRAAMNAGLDVDLRDGSSRRGQITTRRWRGQVTERQAERIDQSGQERLARSLLPQGGFDSLDNLGWTQTSGGWEFRIQSSVPYAGYVHETDRPAKGEYWDHTKGGKGWSTPGTGAKYIEANVDARRMAEAMAARISARVRA